MKSIADMTLKEKIGQMLVCGFQGTHPSSEMLSLIRERHIGGILYFSRNLDTPDNVYAMSELLQQRAVEASGIPLLIAIDQEGGMVSRRWKGMIRMPGNMALGAVGEPEAVFQTARIVAKQLRYMGINANFAPCLDVNNNPYNPVIGVRSYGDDPTFVAAMGAAAIRGYQQSGIAAAAKHFPGHGDTRTDSHLALPVIERDERRIRSLELVPFQRAVKEGVDMIMTAHVVFPAVDESRLPSTLSSRVIDGLLRKELEYSGVVITDCLEMKAIEDHYGLEEAAVMAVRAGVDLLLVSHTPDKQLLVLEGLEKAVRDGKVDESRIDRSVSRILALKHKRDMGRTDRLTEADKRRLEEEQIRWAEAIAGKSVTLVRDQKGGLPLDASERTLVVWPEVRRQTEIDEAYRQIETLGYFLQQHIPRVEEVRVGLDPAAEEMHEVLDKCVAFDRIVIATYNVSQHSEQRACVKEGFKRCGDRTILVSVRNPSDLLDLPETACYLAAYENGPSAMKAVAEVLLGKRVPRGKLPVDLF